MSFEAVPPGTLYHLIVAPFNVAETPAPLIHEIPEKLLCCLWFDATWRPSSLVSLDGRALTVLSPGQWNRQAGPDFRQAVIVFEDGERCVGDVEVHRLSSGWTAHRHHLDARYNQVILHVVFRNDRRQMDVVRADGEPVPQVALETCLPHSLAVYRDEISLDDYPHKRVPHIGRCYTALRRLPLSDVQQFLERAGETRLQRRVSRWRSRVAAVGRGQGMYEAVFRALGAVGYRQRFQDLARRLPWHETQRCLVGIPESQRDVAAEALLLGWAGFIPRDLTDRTDAETRTYYAWIDWHWTRFPADMRQEAWSGLRWEQLHVRPMNTPERRLAGMAQLVTHYHDTDLFQVGQALCDRFRGHGDIKSARALCRALVDLFATPFSSPSYWSQRAHLGSRPVRAQRLIGAQRALTIVVDAILPLLLLDAQQRNDTSLCHTLLACYRTVPRLPDNAVLRDMARRLLGHDAELMALVKQARHQQGIQQIFDDFCSHNEGDCQGCDFPLLS